ncbi:MAG: isoprenylcysteine carboxylmethyltransferase family protein [Pedobacter sp.]
MHGTELGGYAYGLWPVVVFNILLFLFFAIGFIRPKKKVEWRSMGAFLGFLVALFTEMYGFPLTIYFLSTWLGDAYPVLDPFSHPSGHLVLVFLGLAHSAVAMAILHLVSNGIIFFGGYLVYKGWILIHGAKEGKLVTGGIYARVRHPQYSGLFLITVGFLVQWPSITTMILWPVLMYTYYRLAMREEKELEKQFGDEFRLYRERVPAFFPQLGKQAR